MHTLATALLGLVALLWIVQGFRAYFGMLKVPFLEQITPPSDASCPAISVLFAARDEAETLPAALASLLAQDYPDFEVIAVDDRSSDATPQILDEFARNHSSLKFVQVHELPKGWLGKPHALVRAYEHATGGWLVFTDADVRFAPDLLRRAMFLAQQRGLDHLTLLTHVDLEGFWEKTAVTFFGMTFVFGNEPWQTSNPRSGRYVGVGAFQLLRRSTYEAIGTHRRLAMEVIDDMKLGKLAKQGGFRSGLAFAGMLLRVRWQSGLRNVVEGVTKNLFAACGYRASVALAGVAATLAISVLPFLALFFAAGVPRVLAGVSVAAAVASHALLIGPTGYSRFYALTHPLGAVIFCYMMLRSMFTTLWRGGVVWRGTLYPLDELKRGLV